MGTPQSATSTELLIHDTKNPRSRPPETSLCALRAAIDEGKRILLVRHHTDGTDQEILLVAELLVLFVTVSEETGEESDKSALVLEQNLDHLVRFLGVRHEDLLLMSGTVEKHKELWTRTVP